MGIYGDHAGATGEFREASMADFRSNSAIELRGKTASRAAKKLMFGLQGKRHQHVVVSGERTAPVRSSRTRYNQRRSVAAQWLVGANAMCGYHTLTVGNNMGNPVDTPPEPLTLKFVGALVEQLGAQMYPSATSTVAELISNAWDADARHVWVNMPFGESWAPDSEITVVDDGHGMTRNQAQNQYLIAGRKRRLADGGSTEGGRQVHGRKGIGKLAAFGTAKILDCRTLRGEETTSFRMEYDDIRNRNPGEDCPLKEDIDAEPLADPDGNELAHGTRIRLSDLRLKRAISEDQFVKSMSRRFAVDRTEMEVFINGRRLERFEMEVEFRFPTAQRMPSDADILIGDDGWGTESLSNGEEVRWWIGFTPLPLEAEYLRGISILGRKKMLQRPFMFERAGGVSGQIGQEYIVGEVEADWLDRGTDIDEDLIQTNRDQLQVEDDRLDALMDWGRRRIRWALAQRLELRRKKAKKEIESPDIQDLLTDFTPSERRILTEIADKAAQIGSPDGNEIRTFMTEVITAQRDRAVRELIERVQVEEEGFQTTFWGLVREFSLIDARKNLTIIEARLKTIERLDQAVKAGATEVPELHKIIKTFPWLLDPRWSLMGDEIDPDTLGEPYEHTKDTETGDRLDFLFALQPKPPATPDELLVVEIKRGRKRNGRTHRVTRQEVNKFHGYATGVLANLTNVKSSPPRVTGLMIADGYTDRAIPVKNNYELSPAPKLEFKTWGDVVDNTRRLHTGWLEVTRGAQSVYAEEDEA